jgi:H+/Cl- antiporter ClcA
VETDAGLHPPFSSRTIVGVLVLGIVVSAAALTFVSVNHAVEAILWHDLPEALGADQPPLWLVVAIPALGGLLVAGAIRLPGHGGHGPLDGLLGSPVHVNALSGALLAAVGSLAFGLVLGPEAPLMAIGGAIALWMAARVYPDDRSHDEYWLYGGLLVALGTILGNPLNSVIIVTELLVVRLGTSVYRALLPALLAAGSGYLLFVGVGPLTGVGEKALSIEGLATPESLHVIEVLLAPVLGVVIGVLTLAVLAMTKPLVRRVRGIPSFVALPVGGATVGLLAMLFQLITGEAAVEVLFSGQANIGAVAASTAGGMLVALLVLKALAFVISASVGFRGGLMFPLLTIGVAAGALVATVVPGISAAAAAAMAVAAVIGGGFRLPFSGVLLAVLLLGPAGPVTTPVAILSSVAAFIAAEQVIRRQATQDATDGPVPDEAPEPAGGSASGDGPRSAGTSDPGSADASRP